MWNALSFFVSNAWESLDDVAVAALVLIVGSSVARVISHVVHDMLRYSRFVTDLITYTLQGFLFGVCLFQVLGTAAVQSFTAGFAVGIGYALQPFIVSLFHGEALFYIFRRGRIAIDREEFDVEGVGLFFTRLRAKGRLVIIPNNKMLDGRLDIRD